MLVACLMFRSKPKGCLTVAPYSNHSLGSILITQKRTISQEKLAVTNTLAYIDLQSVTKKSVVMVT